IDQWLTIKNISENPGIKQHELAENVFKDNASITRIVELLVRAKYLKRKIHREDRRRTELIVTPEGEDILKKVSLVILQNRKQALQGISLKELEIVDKILRSITKNCRKQDPS
ncbi:MAG: MarR family transcriptional regulator, partial [Acidobacteria bacterium]|nr:MarR family transcriptional regulator [Acidobacteriota bacterium]